MEIEFYEKDGNCPVEEYLTDLKRNGQTDQRKKLLKKIELLGKLGQDIYTTKGIQVSRKLTGDLFELKSDHNRVVYFFFSVKSNKIVLLHAFQKKTQKTPQSEIEKAEREKAEYIKRNGE